MNNISDKLTVLQQTLENWPRMLKVINVASETDEAIKTQNEIFNDSLM